MKTKTTWFAIGFVVSWLTWSMISYIRLRPQDLTQSWPSELGQFGGDVVPWLRYAEVRDVGGVVVCASSEEGNASALIASREASSPQVIIFDDNLDGKIDSVVVSSYGSQSVSVNDENGDGRLDWYSMSHELSESNSISLIDGNMDGQFDTRMHSGGLVDVWIEGEWRQRTSRNGNYYVELSSGTTEVVMANRIWAVKR